MSVAKKVVVSVTTAALAASMVCAAPVAMAQEVPATTQAGSTYVSMAKAKKVNLAVGTSTTLKVKGKKVTKWTSSKKSVVTVSKKGKITGKKAGKATVTATYRGGKTAFNVIVSKNKMSDLIALVKKKGSEREKGEWVYSLGENEDLLVCYYSEDRRVDFYNEAIKSMGRSFDISVDSYDSCATFNSVNIAGNYENYSAKVKMVSGKPSSLKWVLTDPDTGKESSVSAEETKALNKHAVAGVDQLNKALKEKTGLQFADIGFAAFPRI